MLATHPDRRGQGLARVLGARAMLAMAADYGYRDFFTGIVPGNAPSEKLCRGMGLRETGLAIVTCADPTVLKGGRMTK
jgi:GNAT superfamily N-acetyltransferase